MSNDSKTKKIQYLQQLSQFINLTALCNEFNKTAKHKVDYNALRTTINGTSSRLKESDLDAIISYVHNTLVPKYFIPSQKLKKEITVSMLKKIVLDETKKMLKRLEDA